MKEAQRVVKWYSHRGQIEAYFRVLKTGCRVEQRQMRTIETLWPMIVLDMITASYLMGLTSYARTTPEAPARRWFAVSEIEAMGACFRQTDFHPESLSIGEAVRLLSKLGGHLGRKSDGPRPVLRSSGEASRNSMSLPKHGSFSPIRKFCG